MKDLKPWDTLSSTEILARPPYLKVWQDKVRLPGGSVIDDYYRIELSEHVVIYAETVDGRILVERNYKHGVGRVNLTLPAGYLEDGEPPLETARRELLEETGYQAERWQSLGAYVVSANQGAGKAHVYLAREARYIRPPEAGDLEEIEVLLLTEKELMRALVAGEVATVSTAATIGLAQSRKYFA